MRILYLSLSYVPSRRASSVQVMKMCTAVARLGHEVILVAKRPERLEGCGDDDFAFYGVEPLVRLEKLPRPAWRGGGLVYWTATAQLLLRRRGWAELVYCRDVVGALAATSLGMPVVFEAHGMPRSRAQRLVWQSVMRAPRFVALVTISEALRQDIAAAGLLPRTVIVAHDAADVVPLSPPAVRTLSRRPRIGYVGSLYRGRGIELILELAQQMPDCQFDLVGGTEKDIERWRRERPPNNVVFHGFHPPGSLRRFYADFDVVVMPYARSGVVGATGATDSSRWASPMKMFEYMSSGVPLVASDLPVLQEVLADGRNALIARADSATDWSQKIRKLLADDALRARLAGAAHEDLLARHTWDERARQVMAQLPPRPA